MAVLSWGKPTIKITKLGDDTATAVTLKTPVEDSTQLTTSKGDKTEAKVEGGGIEAVKYKRNTYALEFTIRLAKGEKKPFDDIDGVISGEWKLELTPEASDAVGITIPRCILSVEDAYTSADGITLKYTADAMIPEGDGTQVTYTNTGS